MVIIIIIIIIITIIIIIVIIIIARMKTPNANFSTPPPMIALTITNNTLP